jgi:hypothetical protein
MGRVGDGGVVSDDGEGFVRREVDAVVGGAGGYEVEFDKVDAPGYIVRKEGR